MPPLWPFWTGLLVFALAYALLLRALRRRAPSQESVQMPRTPTTPPATPAADPDAPLSPDELERYARHIVLREIGGAGQQALKRARLLVIGAGGLGSPALLYLAAAGVGRLEVVDDDAVSLSNLQRQVLHRTDRIGMNKAESARLALAGLNPHVTVVPRPERLTADNAEALIGAVDMVLDGSDNFATRHLANETCVRLGKPLLSAAISQWEGQIGLYDPATGGPCYACVFPEIPAPGLAPSCAEAGVMGALPGVVGAMMAVEAIKAITGAGQVLKGEILIYDALYGESRKLKAPRRAGCRVCGAGAGR